MSKSSAATLAAAVSVAALACKGTGSAESAVACPVSSVLAYLPPDDVPSGEPCDAADPCTVFTAVPCPPAAHAQPPITQWGCTCTSSVWDCKIVEESHGYCGNPAPPTDASPDQSASGLDGSAD